MKNDNRTKITFDYDGKPYTLVYSADSLKKMERVYKINFREAKDRIFTFGEDLFIGAFIENHDDVSEEKRTEIYSALCSKVDGGKESLAEVLSMMVKEAIDDMQPKGNVSWKVERKA